MKHAAMIAAGVMTAGIAASFAFTGLDASASDQIPVTIEFEGAYNVAPPESFPFLLPGAEGGGPFFGGEVDAYPIASGDPFKATISTFLPSPESFDAGTTGITAQADGTYKIALVGPNNTAGSVDPGIATITGFETDGPVTQVLSAGQPLGSRGLFVTYDPATRGYTLGVEDGGFIASKFDAPGYIFYADTGALELAASTCLGGSRAACEVFGDGGFSLSGTLTSIFSSAIPIWSSDGSIFSSFGLGAEGSWSISGIGGSGGGGGGATPVPEPSMMLLFGGGAYAVLRRRRKTPASRAT